MSTTRWKILAAALLALPLVVASQACPAGEPLVLDQNFVGTVLTAVDEEGAVLALRLDAVWAEDGGWLSYSLSVIDGDGLEGEGSKPLCGQRGEGPNRAIPLSGTWRADGRWQAGGVTLACFGGVLAKCARWGYLPWETRRGRSLKPYHQACTRLLRADYCGDGKGHTENGTPINLWDDLGVQGREAVPGMAFEAAWTPEGAFGIRRTRFPAAMRYVRRTCPERLAEDDSAACGVGSGASPLLCNESYPRAPGRSRD